VGYTLDELKNEITGGGTPASFEPTIDYVVTKIPRFTFEKFPGANTRLTHPDEVGGRGHGHRPQLPGILSEGAQEPGARLRRIRRAAHPAFERGGERQALVRASVAGPARILYVADAFRAGWTLEQAFDATKIDPWFLSQIEDLVREEARLREEGFDSLSSHGCGR